MPVVHHDGANLYILPLRLIALMAINLNQDRIKIFNFLFFDLKKCSDLYIAVIHSLHDSIR
jgi:hypothetical protein